MCIIYYTHTVNTALGKISISYITSVKDVSSLKPRGREVICVIPVGVASNASIVPSNRSQLAGFIAELARKICMGLITMVCVN